MGKKPPLRECALCDKRAKLRHSHIIPEFQYRPLYDPRHRFSVISTKPQVRSKWEQKGAREYLLCEACEQKFSKLESYAKRVIFEDELHLVERLPGGVKLGGVDYTKFRLYLLSVLWRMGVSGLPMFANVDLGEHAELLRIALLSEKPGEAHEYTALVSFYYWPDIGSAVSTQTGFWSPIYTETMGLVIVAWLYPVCYTFFDSAQNLYTFPADLAISKAGTLVMLIRDVREVPFVKDALMRQQLKAQGPNFQFNPFSRFHLQREEEVAAVLGTALTLLATDA